MAYFIFKFWWVFLIIGGACLLYAWNTDLLKGDSEDDENDEDENVEYVDEYDDF